MAIFHVHLDVRSFLLKNFEDFNEHIRLFSDEIGKPVSVAEAKNFLLEELSKGHEVIPIGECSNFDYKKGCLGHPAEEK